MSARIPNEGSLSLAEEPPSATWFLLKLDDLRLYRRRLAEEQEKVSYWRRLVHARLDMLEAEAHPERRRRTPSFPTECSVSSTPSPVSSRPLACPSRRSLCPGFAAPSST